MCRKSLPIDTCQEELQEQQKQEEAEQCRRQNRFCQSGHEMNGRSPLERTLISEGNFLAENIDFKFAQF